jgi:hypothetical protein
MTYFRGKTFRVNIPEFQSSKLLMVKLGILKFWNPWDPEIPYSTLT